MGTLKSNFLNIIYSLINIFKIIISNFDYKKIFTISNLIKLIFIYIVSIIFVILTSFTFSNNFWQKLFAGNFYNKKVAIYSSSDHIGENMLLNRMIETLDKYPVDYYTIAFSTPLSDFWLTKHLYHTTANIINYFFNPQFNLSLTHHVKIIPNGYNIVYLNMPRHSLFDVYGKFLTKWEHLNYYDEYADLYSFVHGENDLLKKIAKDKKITPIYLAHNDTKYKEVENFEKALVTGTLWGCGRSALRVKLALKKLADEGYLIAIGLPGSYKFLEDKYLGKLEKFGPIASAMTQQQRKYGISIVLHNQEHMLESIPTSRILETVSSGALVISDNNKFIKRYFGDNVLYFDIFASTEEIYQKIKGYIIWARNNKELALQKTKTAHKIFKDDLTIEKQLEHLIKLSD